MKFFLSVAALLICAMAITSPLKVLGQSAPPVTIDTCAPLLTPNASATSAPSFMGIPLASITSTSAGMHIVFVNDSQQVVKLVNFGVDSNGNRFIVRDVGTFSPGVSIDHQYRNGAGQGFILPSFIAPNVKCSVTSVEFADGTLWRPGQPPNVVPNAIASPEQSGLSVSPKQLTLNSRSEAALFFVQSATRVADLKETDNCTGIATILVGASGDRAVSYYVRPIAPGTCAAHMINETGATVSIPISVH
jgi:hypothetical protein